MKSDQGRDQPWTTLITAAELAQAIPQAHVIVIDCRFSLADVHKGKQLFDQARLPSAIYAHLDHDLSGDIVPGESGRHPLPTIANLIHTFSGWGITPHSQVVAYDDFGGGVAARLWWLLQWLGHRAVAVLDGGYPTWQGLDLPIETGPAREPKPTLFQARELPNRLVDASQVQSWRMQPDARILDARGAIRYRGEQEPIDPVAGHIPGALSAPFSENLDQSGLFHSKAKLSARFEQLLNDVPSERCAVYCGSGVTAAHNLLAMVHAGWGWAKLYPGSWSQWITDPKRPIATHDG